jgi:hypothetical protein
VALPELRDILRPSKVRIYDLFGLHPVPESATRAYSRLSRYDATGLLWLLRGRSVVAMTAREAAIQGRSSVLVYRKVEHPPRQSAGSEAKSGRVP